MYWSGLFCFVLFFLDSRYGHGPNVWLCVYVCVCVWAQGSQPPFTRKLHFFLSSEEAKLCVCVRERERGITPSYHTLYLMRLRLRTEEDPLLPFHYAQSGDTGRSLSEEEEQKSFQHYAIKVLGFGFFFVLLLLLYNIKTDLDKIRDLKATLLATVFTPSFL